MNNKEKFKAYRDSYVIQGGPVGVLLVHSLGGSPMELRFVAQALGRQGYTVYCPLLPGMGGGTDLSALSTRSDWLDAFKAAHDELLSCCDKVIVGGMSAGCMLALRLAEERPDKVHGLIMFAPTFWPNGWALPKRMHLFKLVRHKVVSSLMLLKQRAPYGIKDERLRSFVLEAFKSDKRPLEDILGRGGKMVWEFRRLARETRRGLGKIKHRMIIFHPREDDQSDISNAMILQRESAGLVEMIVLDDCYHMVTLDRQRGIVADRTVEFAQRLLSQLAAQEAAEAVAAAKSNRRTKDKAAAD
ncbi:MAG: alpha/beta hydrolase [Hyphomicrobium sp.]